MVAVPAIGIALLSAGEMAGVLRDGGERPNGAGADSGAIVLPEAQRKAAAERAARGVPVEVVASVPTTASFEDGAADAAADAAPTPGSSSSSPSDAAAQGRGDDRERDTATAGRGSTSASDRPALGTPPATPVAPPAATAAAAPVAAPAPAPSHGAPIAAAARQRLRLSVKSLDRIAPTATSPAALQLGVSVVDEANGKPASGLPETVSVKVAVPSSDEQTASTGASSLHVRLAMLDSRASGDTPLTPGDVALRVRLAFSDSSVDQPVLKRTAAESESASSTLHVWVPLNKEPNEQPGEPGEPGGEPQPQPAPEPLPVEDPEETGEDVAPTPDSASIDVVVPVSDLTPGESSSHEVAVPVSDPSSPDTSSPVTVEVEGSAPPAEPEPQVDPAPAPAPAPVAPAEPAAAPVEPAASEPADASASEPEPLEPAEAPATP